MLSVTYLHVENSKTFNNPIDMDDRYEISDYGYGKSFVKIMQVHKDGLKHSIKEFEVSTTLQLDSHKDYKHGDNSDIVATDSQKNTVYVLAKKYGIKCPEEFGMLLCKHFLDTYSQVIGVNIHIEEYPWERIADGNQSHNHAFIFTPTAMRVANVSQKRYGKFTITAGLQKMRVLKTTQSSFVKFVRDGFTTLGDAEDRIFSTNVEAKWTYSATYGFNFDDTWNCVKNYIIDVFAGDLEKGIPSPSVQNTIYMAEKKILDNIPQISKVEMVMPNIHYFNVDFNKFPSHLCSGDNKIDILQPVDKPSGMIRGELSRKGLSKL